MPTKSVSQMDSLRYPFHCYLTSANRSLGLCSCGYCRLVMMGSVFLHLRKTIAELLMFPSIVVAAWAMQNLNRQALDGSPPDLPDEWQHLRLGGEVLNGCRALLTDHLNWVSHLKAESLEHRLKKRVIQRRWQPDALVVVEKNRAHVWSESSIVSCYFFPCSVLLFYYCSALFIIFTPFRSQ